MRALVIFIAALSTMAAAYAQSEASEQWWSYLASYDAGPGSTRVDLGLRKQVPIAGYSTLVVTGPTYLTSQKSGLPEISDLDRHNALQEKIVAAIAKQSPSIYTGTFTHNFEQLHYVYLRGDSGVLQALTSVYREHCQDCKTYTNIKQDPTWEAYSNFLYPNQATLEHYGLKLK